MKVNKIAFEGPKTPDRGYTIRACYLKEPDSGTALIAIMKDGEVVKEFTYPAYKIWNLQAHFRDIVDSHIAGDEKGHAIAGSDGLGGGVMPGTIAKVTE